jgi:(p)ppGpp synthase/HD superfamily hydrolase
MREEGKMNKNLEKIRDYLIERGVDEKTVNSGMTSSVYLAMEIMEYAHRNQKRENGEDYANHPARCLTAYRELIGIGPDGDRVMDKDIMIKNRVPFDGVQEVCLLHDVVEDTEFTLDDVREIYVECGFENYFDIYIKDALERITHDKAVDYGEYIKICLKNPISALVKMIDMEDNLRILDLVKYDEERYHRAQGYLFWTFVINEAYHFVENVENYKKQFKEDAE